MLLIPEDGSDQDEEELHVVGAGALITLVTSGDAGEGPGPARTEFSLSHPVTNTITPVTLSAAPAYDVYS